MKSLYDQISDLADRVEEAAALLRRMADGDADAARELSHRCRTVPYSGEVLCFDVDSLIGEVLADEDVFTEG